MIFWVVAALLTLGACLAVMLPTIRGRAQTLAGEEHNLEVFQDQLAELDRDIARGSIDAAEAEQARAEIGRRIIKLAGQTQAGDSGRRHGLGRIVASVAILAIPFASWGIYAATGSPHLPGQPLEARISQDPQAASVSELIARAEAHLSNNPEDGRGWDVLAPIYYRMGRYNDSVVAYRNAIRLLGPNAIREANLGEALAAAAGGTVTADAVAALQRALETEPDNPKARFLIAVGLAQEGRNEEAEQAWLDMVAGLPEGSPWRSAAEQAIAGLTQGPGAVDNAGGLILDNDQTRMIDEMVAGLDRRLADNPDDPEGWQRLIHSYVVLGRAGDAASALARGLEALGRDTDAGTTLTAFAAERGIVAEAVNRTDDRE